MFIMLPAKITLTLKSVLIMRVSLNLNLVFTNCPETQLNIKRINVAIYI